MALRAKLLIFIFLFILFLIPANSSEEIQYNNDKYSDFFLGNWVTVTIKPEKILFSIIKKIQIDFMKSNRFSAKADFILGIKKQWGGEYKIASDRIFLMFDNGARETIYYNIENSTKMATLQPDKISAVFIKTTL